jgi:L-asparaginase/beta-aspartyl-peptidase (threonine type)
LPRRCNCHPLAHIKAPHAREARSHQTRGFLAGRLGAIACTGIGEHIVRHLLASTAYRWLESGMRLDEAPERAIGLMPEGLSIGMIGIDAHGSHVASRSPMACAMLE